MVKKRAGRFRRILIGVLLGLALLCLVGVGISAWSNRSLPEGPQNVDQLDPLDRTRLEETWHLKANLGDRAWPGLGQAAIPVSLHSGEYSFLVGYPGTPPAGWEVVEGDTFLGEPYYRKREAEPQNFAIQVGDTWAAGMATKSEMDRFIVKIYRELLPPVIEQIFPYRLLFQSTEVQIGGVLHECFHVFQAQNVPDRLDAAEKAHRWGDAYWGVGEEALDLWKAEMNLLAKALQADTDQEAAAFAREFLTHRQSRRAEIGLAAELIDYERQLEWEEGLAKYVELEILRQVYSAHDYQPVQGMQDDPSFKAYRTFPQRWSQEILQMKLAANQDGEVSFYMTGMAQAYLLDRLYPGWKDKVFAEGVFLEDLLEEVLAK
jgi:hypothetical protein